MNKVAQAIAAAGFDTFAELLAQSGQVDVLEDGRAYTIFAPVNAAFAKLKKSALENLRRETEHLGVVLGYHFAPGKVLSRQFVGKRIRATTYSGDKLLIEDKGGLLVNGAKIVRPDVLLDVGVAHGIDAILWPCASKSSQPQEGRGKRAR